MKAILQLAFILLCLNCHSQTQKMTSFGAKAGYNNSNISGKDSNGDELGYLGNEIYVGLFSDFQLFQKVNFQAELIYSYTEDYNFLEVPLNIKYQLYKKLYVFAGPKLDFILDNDEDVSEDNYEFRNFGVSADFGVQYYFIEKFFAELRYSIGFEEQLKRDIQLDINNATRNTFRIGLGYKF